MNVLKFKRNEPCSCGSNKKYKNFCMLFSMRVSLKQEEEVVVFGEAKNPLFE